MPADLITAATHVQDLVENRYDDLTTVENLTLAKARNLITRTVVVMTHGQLMDLYTEGQEQVRWEEPTDFGMHPDGRVVLFGRAEVRTAG